MHAHLKGCRFEVLLIGVEGNSLFKNNLVDECKVDVHIYRNKRYIYLSL